MNILILLGSPKKHGNTATVLEFMTSEFKRMGHTAESVYLNGKVVNACLGCMKCKETYDLPGCVHDDDGPDIFEKVMKADLVLFASPLYFWGFPAQLKLVIDRSYSLVTDYKRPTHTSLIEGRRQALLVTGGGIYENNAEPVFTAFDKLVEFYKGINAGSLFIGGCTSPEEMEDDVRDQAVSFAGKIVE
ncbi:MAG: flavodoxin family protein [Desulfobacteraceae bacterium]